VFAQAAQASLPASCVGESRHKRTASAKHARHQIPEFMYRFVDMPWRPSKVPVSASLMARGRMHAGAG
jgi:hypothetical protein